MKKESRESDSDLNVDKYPKKPIMDDSNSTSCCLCHRYVRKKVRNVCIANVKWVKYCWVL